MKKLKIIVGGKDVTPRPLVFDMQRFKMESEEPIAEDQPVVLRDDSSCSSLWKVGSVVEGSIQYPLSASRMEQFVFDPNELSVGSPTEEIATKTRPPLRARPELPPRPLPPKIVLVLRETETFILAERPSLVCVRDLEDAERIVRDNAHHEYMTCGPGHRRYVRVAETQTTYSMLKMRQALTPLVATGDKAVMASTFDLHQTFNEPA